MADFVLGIDAGGTKTRAAAFPAPEENEPIRANRADPTAFFPPVPIAEGWGGCGNAALSPDEAAEAVRSAAEEAIRRAGECGRTRCRTILCGAAGASVRVGEGTAGEILRDALLPLCPNVTVITDAELALIAQFGTEGDGMLIISGTGSVVFLRESGHLRRSGGWGHLLGDGGSGYHLGISLLRALVRQRDSGTIDPAVENTIFDHLRGSPRVQDRLRGSPRGQDRCVFSQNGEQSHEGGVCPSGVFPHPGSSHGQDRRTCSQNGERSHEGGVCPSGVFPHPGSPRGQDRRTCSQNGEQSHEGGVCPSGVFPHPGEEPPDYAALTAFVYGNPKSAVADLAPLVERLAEAGNPTAAAVMEESAIELAEDALRLLNSPAGVPFPPSPDPLPLALTGGGFEHLPLFRRVFEEKLLSRSPRPLAILNQTVDPAAAVLRLPIPNSTPYGGTI